jgi:hypothetical protein
MGRWRKKIVWQAGIQASRRVSFNAGFVAARAAPISSGQASFPGIAVVRAGPGNYGPAGSITRNTEPCGRMGEADSRPPCDSTIERLMDKPSPMPFGLVL